MQREGDSLDFAAWLTRNRERASLTQRDLARKCGVSAAYIAHLESGTSEPPPLKTCKRLAAALGVDSNEVWQHSFAARLKRWLKREGFSSIDEDNISELVKRISSLTQ